MISYAIWGYRIFRETHRDSVSQPDLYDSGANIRVFSTWFGCAGSCNISFRRHIIETKAKPDDPLLLCMSPARELAVQVENEAHKFGALVDYAADTLWDMFTLSGLAYYVFYCKI